MKITAICNAGIYLEEDGCGLLIDGVERGAQSFLATAPDLLNEMHLREGIFQSLKYFTFTHEHPDHFDSELMHPFINDGYGVFCPWQMVDKTPFQAGPFTIEYANIPHMPFPGELNKNYSLFIETESGAAVYIAGDASCIPDVHEHFISKRKITHMFMNHTYFSTSVGERWLRELNPQFLYLYHIPENPEDAIHKKAVKVFDRERIEFPQLRLIDKYPKLLFQDNI